MVMPNKNCIYTDMPNTVLNPGDNLKDAYKGKRASVDCNSSSDLENGQALSQSYIFILWQIIKIRVLSTIERCLADARKPGRRKRIDARKQ